MSEEKLPKALHSIGQFTQNITWYSRYKISPYWKIMGFGTRKFKFKPQFQVLAHDLT